MTFLVYGRIAVPAWFVRRFGNRWTVALYPEHVLLQVPGAFVVRG